ncbi:helix-turn-helix domain-containing protein [Symbiobacterium terraclitae]|uniref:helix-turn-helix domain-containing protein n=1 Tax=Symbiobacterium terraclitae TaxID=557451 RepID=UPI0035B51E30
MPKPKQQSKPSRPRLEDLPDVLTVNDLMAFLNRGRNSVYRLLRSGQIRAIGGNGPNRFFSDWRVSKQALIDYLRGEEGRTA